MNRYRTVAVAALAGGALIAGDASAFCVYNGTDKDILFAQTQVSVKQMNKVIKPKERGCCNWENKDCNPKKKQNQILEATVLTDYATKLSSYSGIRCGIFYQGEGAKIKHEAGGTIAISNYAQYDGTKASSYTNPKHYVISNTHEGKLMGRYVCPPLDKKPTGAEFLPGVGDLVEVLIGLVY